RIGFVPLDSMDFAGMVSMFINRRSIAKYGQVIAGNWSAGIAIDLFLRQQVHGGRLAAYVTAPFVTSVSPANAESDIRGAHDFAHAVYDLYRRAFYIEADQDAILRQMTRMVAGARLPKLASIFLTAHGAAMSDRWKEF